ncbi:MAG: hypothetical protein AAF702_27360 [Chloroflexota bacterium]
MALNNLTNLWFLSQRRPSFFLYSIWVLFLVTSCVPLDLSEPTSGTVVQNEDVSISVAVETPNEALVQPQTRPITIDVTSPKGMGRAQIQFSAHDKQEEIRLHFQLKGLERLVVTADTTTVLASVSAIDPLYISQELVKRGTESASASSDGQSISDAHPFWLTIEAVSVASTNSDTAAPLADTIVVTIPPALLTEATEQITIEWLDFYR